MCSPHSGPVCLRADKLRRKADKVFKLVPAPSAAEPAQALRCLSLMCILVHLTAGHQVRHLLQLPALPTPAAVSTSSATAAASASSPADATATASSNASGDTLSGEYPSFGECQTAAAALAGAGGSPGGRRLLTGWTRGRSSRTRNLLDMQDYFRGAVTTANASGATFGSPNWQNAFITSCASQASGSAVVTAGRRPSALEPGK